MDDLPKTTAAPPGWLESLERAEADVSAGRTVSGEGLMRRLKETLAEMESRGARPGRKAKRRR